MPTVRRPIRNLASQRNRTVFRTLRKDGLTPPFAGLPGADDFRAGGPPLAVKPRVGTATLIQSLRCAERTCSCFVTTATIQHRLLI